MTSPRLAKLARVAPSITSQKHLDKVILSFRGEELPLAKEILRGILPASLEVGDPEEVPIVPKDEAAPTIQEETAMRLTSQAAQILSQKAEIDRLTNELSVREQREKELVELLAKSKESVK
jgi:hypothetical protein